MTQRGVGGCVSIRGKTVELNNWCPGTTIFRHYHCPAVVVMMWWFIRWLVVLYFTCPSTDPADHLCWMINWQWGGEREVVDMPLTDRLMKYSSVQMCPWYNEPGPDLPMMMVNKLVDASQSVAVWLSDSRWICNAWIEWWNGHTIHLRFAQKASSPHTFVEHQLITIHKSSALLFVPESPYTWHYPRDWTHWASLTSSHWRSRQQRVLWRSSRGLIGYCGYVAGTKWCCGWYRVWYPFPN